MESTTIGAEMDSQEKDLILRAMSGDEDAFSELYKMKFDSILIHALSILKNKHDAEDIAQEIVVKMYAHIGKLNEPENLNAWMHKIVRNMCLSHVRSAAVRREYASDMTDYEAQIVEEDVDLLPAAYAENAETNEILIRAIDSLPPKQHEAITMYYFDEMSYKEIAYAVNSTASSVSTNIIKAKKNIKKYLEQTMGEHKNNMMAGMLPMSVAGEALRENVSKTFPSSERSSIYNSIDMKIKSGGATHLNRPRLNAVAIVASIVIATAGITGGILAVVHPASAADGQFKSGTASDDITAATDLSAGAIAYVGECECGHLNPSGAQLTGIDLDKTITAWTISKNEGTSEINPLEIIAEGEGTDADVELAKLYETKSDGDYVLTYTVKDEADHTAIIQRIFHIDTGKIIPGSYK